MKVNFKRILKNKKIENGLWLYFLQIFNTVLPLLTLPYITRVLSVHQYGVFSIAINLIAYLQVLVEYGFDMSATRKVALMEKDTKEYSFLFTSVMASRLLLLLIAFIGILLYLPFIKNDRVQQIAIIVLFLGVIGSALQQNWLFQGMQEMKYISIVNIISRTTSVSLIFTLVKEPSDLLVYCLLYSISPIISGVLGVLIVRNKFKIKFTRLSRVDVIDELKDGWYVFTTSLSGKVFGAIGITFLGVFSDKEVVGIYSAIQKIPSMILLLWMPVGQVLYPVASRKMKISFDEGKKYVYKARSMIIPFFVIIVIGASVLSKEIVKIAFGQEYVLYFYWIIPLLIWLVFAINNNFLGIQILLSSGRDKEYSQCFQIGVLFTIVLNFVLIYLFEGNGAAVAPLISEMVLTILLLNKIRKI